MRLRLFPVVAFALLAACSPSDGTVLLDDNAFYSLRYPSHWTLESGVTMPEAGYEAPGTLLTYPAELDYTTLTDAAVHVYAGTVCPSLEKVEMVGNAATAVIGGETWQRVTRDGAGAGNRYQGDTYMLMRKNTCYAISTLLHSCNLGSDCGENHTIPFDKAAMDKAFAKILSTFAFRP